MRKLNRKADRGGGKMPSGGRAIVTPGIGSAAEFVRLACEEVLAMPSHRLISSD